jgi:HEAT repeat protein
LLAIANAPNGSPAAPDCETLDRCIALLETHQLPQPGGGSGIRVEPIAKVLERLYGFGAPAVDRMVALLKHENSEVRKRAAYGLRQFARIDERHLPELIRAFRAGEVWLPAAIARTGSDSALRFLQDELLGEESPDQIRYALTLLGRRSEPFLIDQLVRCRTSCPIEHGEEALRTLSELGPLSGPAVEAIQALAALKSAPEALRVSMEDALIFHRQPPGVDILLGRLAAEETKAGRDFNLSLIIDKLGDYESRAEHAGPALLPLLARRDLPDARAEAVLTLGRIGHRPAVPALVALLDEAEPDWLLGYNAVESLARLGATDAKGQISRLARAHWFRPVRNNAARALSLLSGSRFELTGVSGRDTEPDYLSLDLRFREDTRPERHCGFGEGHGTDPIQLRPRAPVTWPDAGVRLAAFAPPPAETAREVMTKVKAFAMRGGEVTLLEPWKGDGWLIGINAGEWGGGLYLIDRRGRPSEVIGTNVIGGLRLGGQVYVLTGLAHLIFDEGRLWRLAPDGRKAVSSIRLPARPRRVAISSDRTLLIRTSRGDVAVTEDGRPKAVEPCP